MNHPLYEPQLSQKLFDELYGVQPQAIIWMLPIWNNDHEAIVDFEFIYSNKEGPKYLKPDRWSILRIAYYHFPNPDQPTAPESTGRTDRRLPSR